MDASREKASGPDDRPYIWLRYSTQFTLNGRPHTISMDVPVPVGASAEEREQLLREAEAGMEQLYRRIESRQRGQRPPAPESALRSEAPAPTPAETRPVAAITRGASGQQPAPAAAQASPDEAASIIRLEDKRPPTMPARSTAGPELPDTHDPGATSPMKVGQFIAALRENWNMTPKEAMELLQLKSLNNVNYRELLHQLEQLMAQRAQSAQPGGALRPSTGTGVGSQPVQLRPSGVSAPPAPPAAARRTPSTSSPVVTKRDGGSQPAREGPSTGRPVAQSRQHPPSQATSSKTPAGHEGEHPAPSSPPSVPPPDVLAGPNNIPVYPLREERLREPLPVYKFDEEEDEGPGPNTHEEGVQSPVSQTMARIKIEELRDAHGTSAASPARLVVLHNLLDSQISAEQLEQLIRGLWKATSDKKLKQEQVEALISWAKEDDFVDEVEAVLAALNEE